MILLNLHFFIFLSKKKLQLHFREDWKSSFSFTDFLFFYSNVSLSPPPLLITTFLCAPPLSAAWTWAVASWSCRPVAKAAARSCRSSTPPQTPSANTTPTKTCEPTPRGGGHQFLCSPPRGATRRGLFLDRLTTQAHAARTRRSIRRRCPWVYIIVLVKQRRSLWFSLYWISLVIRADEAGYEPRSLWVSSFFMIILYIPRQRGLGKETINLNFLNVL